MTWESTSFLISNVERTISGGRSSCDKVEERICNGKEDGTFGEDGMDVSTKDCGMGEETWEGWKWRAKKEYGKVELVKVSLELEGSSLMVITRSSGDRYNVSTHVDYL